MAQTRTCSIDGCERPASSRGWCEAHYARWRRLGDVRADQPVVQYFSGRICSVYGCDHRSDALGLCVMHYQRQRVDQMPSKRVGAPFPRSSPRRDLYVPPTLTENQIEIANAEPLTERERQILDGELLGDGCSRLDRGYRNASLLWHQKSLQHTELLAAEFARFVTSFTRRKDAKYGWYLRTRVHPTLTVNHHRWYRPKKIVPLDIRLTPLVCLHWFIGDGMRRPNGGLEICTHSFTFDEVDRLGGILAGFGIGARLRTDRSLGGVKPVLTMGRSEAEAFLEYIGPCPFTDYAHKWDRSGLPTRRRAPIRMQRTRACQPRLF